MIPWLAIGIGLAAGFLARAAFGGGRGGGARTFWPVRPYRGTISGFGVYRPSIDGVNTRQHAGVDVGAFIGDAVIAMGDGEVLWPVSGFRIGADLQAVAIRHSDADYIYAEIHVDPKYMVPGTRVSAGQQIGKVGRNGDGNAMLHLEAWQPDFCPKGFVPWVSGVRPKGLLDVWERIKGLAPATTKKVA
jgi:murein DD-endopeptidase MepM/ murein hydrolase activator NlpD